MSNDVNRVYVSQDGNTRTQADVDRERAAEKAATPAPAHKTGGADSQIFVTHNGGENRVTYGTGYREKSGPSDSVKDPMQRLTTVHGSSVSAYDASPDAWVQLGSDRLPLKAAEASGLVQRTAQGWVLTPDGRSAAGFNEATAGTDQEQSVAQDQKDQPQESPAGWDPTAVMPESAEKFISASMQAVPESVLLGVQEAVLQSKDVSAFANDIASAMKIEPEQVREQIASIYDAQVEITKKAISEQVSGDFDWQEFSGWAQEQRPEELRKAVDAQWQRGNLAPMRALAKSYRSAMDNAVRSADLGEGVTVFDGPDGQVMLTLRGHGAMSYREAIRRGLIAISQRGGK